MADSDGGPSCPGAVGRLAWVPIPVLLATIVALRLHQVETVFEPMLLMPALSIIFSGGVSGVIVALGSRSYARDPSRAVLLLSCGMLAFGLAGLSGGVLLPEAPLNAAVTVYNTGSWLTGLCCLTSAMGALVPRSDRRAGRPRLVMLSAYAAVLACMAAVTLAATSGLTPPFFAQGQGPTLLRQMVLGSAAAMTALAAVLYGLLNVRVQSAFVRWYALGLGLFALGLVGMMPMHRLGSVSAWVGRSAQYLGCLYILWGAWRGVVEGRSWELPLGTLLETQERHRRLVEVCPDAILVHTDGRCVFANPAAVRLLGAASPQDLMGRPILDFIHPECREISAARIRQAYESDRPVPVRTLRVLRLDGSPVDVEITGSRVDFGGRMAVQAVMRDVGERVRAEEALRESERRFKATFENAAVGLAHVALDGRFLWVNRQFCEVTGYGADELLGRTFQQITFADGC
jgi:PAS domain S-box-containing protein